ncbi:5-formyltetrahydrofolate cyclo-ligase [Desulfatitalea tepidiphila]|uniref:5-formyltetrahydrofolate cyclo-ligase n=1 Tax=Desulfatitalea tepidiphila TaxID=1185843 RepID=UPI0006B459EF|nr:5-formyltetrahydrofolate cyclo-ligase [Desulfatitalea tepidiphila]
MEEIREKKQDIRNEVARKISALSADEVTQRTRAIENRLFEFANFLESRIVLLYTPAPNEVDTLEIIRRSYLYGKIIVLPAFDPNSRSMRLFKVDDLNRDLAQGTRGNLEPNPKRCKSVPIDCLDIAIIPGVAMDEKGGRVGQGNGYYDRLIPDLPITTRKVGLVYELQIVSSVPLESHDKHVDIVITEDRVIYKI